MSIKLQRAKNLADVGQYHHTWYVILNAMPDSLKERCTAAELAQIADAMRAQFLRGQAVAAK